MSNPDKTMTLPVVNPDVKPPQRVLPKLSLGLLLMAAGVSLVCIVIWRAVEDWRLLTNTHHAPIASVPGLPPLALQPPVLSPSRPEGPGFRGPPLSLAAPSGARLFPDPVARVQRGAQPAAIQIPAIGLDAAIVPVSPFSSTTRSGEIRWAWATAEYAVGHLDSTATPGAGGNVVLAGHNNTKGEVFRHLSRLKAGEVITITTGSGPYSYVVTEVTIVPYRKDPIAGEATLQRYIAGATSERLTLLSCYPYWTNSDRIVVVATPQSVNHPPDQTDKRVILPASRSIPFAPPLQLNQIHNKMPETQ